MDNEVVEKKTEQGLTQEELLRFKDSTVYTAFMATAGLRMASIRDDLSKPSMTKDLETVRFLQGEMLGVEFWVRFTDTLIKEATNDTGTE